MEIHLENLEDFFRNPQEIIQKSRHPDGSYWINYPVDEFIFREDYIGKCPMNMESVESCEYSCVRRHRPNDVTFEAYHYIAEDGDLFPPFRKEDLERYCTEALESKDWKLFISFDRGQDFAIIDNPESFLVYNPFQLKIFLIEYAYPMVQLEIHPDEDSFYQSLEEVIRFSQYEKTDSEPFPCDHRYHPQDVYDITSDKISFFRETSRVGQLLTFRKGETVKYWLQNHPPYWAKGIIRDFNVITSKYGNPIKRWGTPILDSHGAPIRHLLPNYQVKINDLWFGFIDMYKESYFATEDTDFIDTLVEQRVAFIEWDKELKVLKPKQSKS